VAFLQVASLVVPKAYCQQVASPQMASGTAKSGNIKILQVITNTKFLEVIISIRTLSCFKFLDNKMTGNTEKSLVQQPCQAQYAGCLERAHYLRNISFSIFLYTVTSNRHTA